MTHKERLLEYTMIYLAEHVATGSVQLETIETFVDHPEKFFSTDALIMSRMGWFIEELSAITGAMKFQESRRRDWSTARRKALVHMINKLARTGYLSIDAIASVTGNSVADFKRWLDEYEQKNGHLRRS